MKKVHKGFKIKVLNKHCCFLHPKKYSVKYRWNFHPIKDLHDYEVSSFIPGFYIPLSPS